MFRISSPRGQFIYVVALRSFFFQICFGHEGGGGGGGGGVRLLKKNGRKDENLFAAVVR